MERFRLIFSTFILVIAFMVPGFSQYQIHRVVIDAGHGGKDPGALGKNSREKDIALAIALKTGEYITKYLPDVEVVYTRKTDVFVELYRRAKIANDAKANLFISNQLIGRRLFHQREVRRSPAFLLRAYAVLA